MKRETRYDYAAAVGMRYQRSGREQKGWILDEFCAATGYNRKYAIKLLRGPFPRAALPPGHGRPPVYGPEEVAVLRPCWQIADFQSSRTPSVGRVTRQPPRLWSDPLLTHHASALPRNFADPGGGVAPRCWLNASARAVPIA